MPRLHHRFLFLAIILIFGSGDLWADPSQKLPVAFKALVPPGYELDSPSLVSAGHMATLSFAARKQLEGRRSLYSSEYHLELVIKQATDEALRNLITMQAPAYRAQYEKDVEAAVNSRRQSESNPVTGFDPPVLTKYAWGVGITQRVIHKYMGAGKAPDEIEYRCIYLGFINTTHAIKNFKLKVSGVETLQEADQWAHEAAEAIQKTSLQDIDSKPSS